MPDPSGTGFILLLQLTTGFVWAKYSIHDVESLLEGQSIRSDTAADSRRLNPSPHLTGDPTVINSYFTGSRFPLSLAECFDSLTSLVIGSLFINHTWPTWIFQEASTGLKLLRRRDEIDWNSSEVQRHLGSGAKNAQNPETNLVLIGSHMTLLQNYTLQSLVMGHYEYKAS